MADLPISQLPSTTSPNGSDVIPIVNSGITKQITLSNLLNYISNNMNNPYNFNSYEISYNSFNNTLVNSGPTVLGGLNYIPLQNNGNTSYFTLFRVYDLASNSGITSSTPYVLQVFSTGYASNDISNGTIPDGGIKLNNGLVFATFGASGSPVTIYGSAAAEAASVSFFYR